MYEAYYQLQTSPFTLLPSPEFLYLGTRHRMALNLLEYGLLNGSPFLVITGAPGTGKTTLLNRLLECADRRWTIGMLSNTHAQLGGLIPWIAAAFRLETHGRSDVELFHEFSRFLEREQEAGRRVLLVLDEAQNVGSAMLEELRLLSNLNDGRRRSLQILLAGQPGLRALVTGVGMEQFAQRIAVEYALEPLDEEETVAYIAYRVQVAGGVRPLFSTLSCRKVFGLTGGIPRLINQVCDHALVYGYAAQAETITARVVLEAARVRARNGFPLFRAAPDSLEPTAEELECEAAETASAPHNAASVSVGPEASPDPQAVYRDAVAFKEAGELSRAVGLFEQLCADPAYGFKALAQKGLCFKAMGRYADALAAFHQALDHAPAANREAVSVRYLLARTLEAMGRTTEAMDMYRSLQSSKTSYRDVGLRMRRLVESAGNGHGAGVEQESWTSSLVRSCRQWWQNSRARRPLSVK